MELQVLGVALRKAMEPLLLIADEATFIFSSDGISLIAHVPKKFVTVVLRIKSSDFIFFRCRESGSAGVYLLKLYEHLQLACNEDMLTIYRDEGEVRFNFVFRNIVTGIFQYSEMNSTEAKEEHVDIDRRLQLKYNAVVGIPSAVFDRIFVALGRHLLASVTITDSQVKLSGYEMNFVLRKQHGECIIGGVGEDEQISVTCKLHSYISYMQALTLTSTVWILQSNDADALPVLNFPAGRLGNIMYYFYN